MESGNIKGLVAQRSVTCLPEDTVLTAIERLRGAKVRPIVVALDGQAGAGKSALAAKVARRVSSALIPLRDFYRADVVEAEWIRRTPEERLKSVLDWERARQLAVAPLRSGRPAVWHGLDYVSGLSADGAYDLQRRVRVVDPAPVILLVGTYSASPALRDLVDLAVLVSTPRAIRSLRVARRAGYSRSTVERWDACWGAVEAHYFDVIQLPATFDILLAERY